MSQKKVKFNIVDIIVILVLIAGITFVGVRMLGDRGTAPAANDPGSTFQVTFYAECVPEAVASSLVEGSKAEDDTRTLDLGTMIQCTVGESVAYAADSRGNLVQTTKPGYVSVTVVCSVSGTRKPTGLLIGKTVLNVGHPMTVCCGMTELNAIILGIDAAA